MWKREKRSGPFGRNELQYSRTRQEPGCFLSNKTGLLYLEESVLEGGSLEFGQLCAPTDQKEGPAGFAWV